MPSLDDFQVNTSAVHDSSFYWIIQISAVLSLSGTQQSQAQQHFKNKFKIIQQQAKLSRMECVLCSLTISNMLNAKRQSMDICLDLSINTNKVTKKTNEALILN